jgi:colanic acid biosynthesis glycosyl transferase WcaI
MLSENSLAVRLARALERFVYRSARGIGVICDGFKHNLIAKGVPPDKIVVMPDYIDLEFMHPLERNNGFREQHSIKTDDFLVMYSGSVAAKQGLITLIEAAYELRDQSNIIFFLIGEGPYLTELKQRAGQLSLHNLRFLPLQPRDGLAQQLAAADVLVITQKRAVTDIVFPGKLLYYMAAGRPILAAVSSDSETGRFVHEKQVGVVVPPEDPKSLAEAISRLYKNGIGLFGQNGRRVAEEQFDRRIVLRRFCDHFSKLLRL